MKRLFLIFLVLLLSLGAASSLADKSPAAARLGSEVNARHLVSHEGAFTDGIPKMAETFNRDGEHLHCCGSRGSLWDTPQKGQNTGHLYPGSKIATLEKNSEFELVKVEQYKGRYYANVRVYEDDRPIRSGWVNADYIACSCSDFSEQEEVPEYQETSLSFSLR